METEKKPDEETQLEDEEKKSKKKPKKKKKSKRDMIQLICFTGIFAALITVFTFFPKVPVPGSNGGYVHLGDTFVYLAASFLPLPFSAIAGGIGGFLADIFSGAAQYSPFTLVIKMLLTLTFTSKKEKILCKRNIVACIVGALITFVGYFLTDCILYSPAAGLATIVWNAIQGVASGVVYVVIVAILDKTNIRKFMRK